MLHHPESRVKSTGILSTERQESARNPSALLKGQGTKPFSQPHPLGSSGGRAARRELDSCLEKMSSVASRTELKGQ